VLLQLLCCGWTRTGDWWTAVFGRGSAILDEETNNNTQQKNRGRVVGDDRDIDFDDVDDEEGRSMQRDHH
jgi:hypothetical protein